MSNPLFRVGLAALFTSAASFAYAQAPAMTEAPAAGAAAGVMVEAEDDDMMVASVNMTVDDLEDMDVVDSTGESVGEVEEALMDESNEVVAVSVEVGGFLGMGETDVIVQLSEMEVVDGNLVLDMTKEQVDALPDWND